MFKLSADKQVGCGILVCWHWMVIAQNVLLVLESVRRRTGGVTKEKAVKGSKKGLFCSRQEWRRFRWACWRCAIVFIWLKKRRTVWTGLVLKVIPGFSHFGLMNKAQWEFFWERNILEKMEYFLKRSIIPTRFSCRHCDSNLMVDQGTVIHFAYACFLMIFPPKLNVIILIVQQYI